MAPGPVSREGLPPTVQPLSPWCPLPFPRAAGPGWAARRAGRSAGETGSAGVPAGPGRPSLWSWWSPGRVCSRVPCLRAQPGTEGPAGKTPPTSVCGSASSAPAPTRCGSRRHVSGGSGPAGRGRRGGVLRVGTGVLWARREKHVQVQHRSSGCETACRTPSTGLRGGPGASMVPGGADGAEKVSTSPPPASLHQGPLSGCCGRPVPTVLASAMGWQGVVVSTGARWGLLRAPGGGRARRRCPRPRASLGGWGLQADTLQALPAAWGSSAGLVGETVSKLPAPPLGPRPPPGLRGCGETGGVAL